jgi:hypothetical protein
MLKKVLTIFGRDVKVNAREFITLYIIFAPLIFAFGINLLAPSVNDTTVNLALVENDNVEMVEYMEQFAKVEVLEDAEAIEDRVGLRDNILGVIPKDNGYYVLQEGNEPDGLVDYATILLTFYEEGLVLEDSNATIHDFGQTVSPLKKMLVSMVIMMTSILGGMLISINIVEEKVDNTVSAINITPTSRTAFILGKSVMGFLVSLIGAYAILFITGFGSIDMGQTAFILIAVAFLSIIVGFIEGVKNTDIMEAAGSIKMLFLPIGAAVAAVELLSDKWQIAFYWIPYYWAYKGLDGILSESIKWQEVLMYSGIIAGLGLLVYLYLAPKIRKGLE